MKNVFVALAIFISSLAVHAQSKVGTIDAEFILSQMPEVTGVEEGLKNYNTQLQENLQANIKNYEELVAGYQANSATFAEEEKATKESEIISLENDIKNFRQKASVLIQVRRTELTKPLYIKIDAAMQDIIASEKFTHIFNTSNNGLAYGDPKFDITEAVIKKLGIEMPKE